jgi:integrase
MPEFSWTTRATWGRAMGKRRMNGEGSIYRRKSDGMWVGVLQVGYKPDGRRDRRTVYGRTKVEVQEKLNDLKRQRDAGVDLTQRSTVSTYMDRWLTMKSTRVRARTHELYSGYVERARERLGRTELAKVTPVMIEGVVAHVAAISGAYTANKVRSTLFSMFKQASRSRLIPFNPVAAVDKLEEDPRPLVMWTREEATRFVATVRSHRLYAFFYLLLATSVRLGEIEALRWADLHGDYIVVSRTVSRVANKLQFTKPKTKHGHRVVTLPPDVIEVLAAHRQRQLAEAAAAADGVFNVSGFMFCNQDGNIITPMALYHVAKRLQEKAGVPRVTTHSLRHLSISMLIRHGVNAEIVAKRVGHRDGAYTYQKYTHVFDESMKEAAIPLNELMDGRKPLN